MTSLTHSFRLVIKETYSLLPKPAEPTKIVVKMEETYSLLTAYKVPLQTSTKIDKKGYYLSHQELHRKCKRCSRQNVVMMNMDGGIFLCHPCWIKPILQDKYKGWIMDLISYHGKQKKAMMPTYDQWRKATSDGSLEHLLEMKRLSLPL